MIQKFRYKISGYLKENINQYESEKTIIFFIQNLGLPKHLIERKKPGENDSSKFPQQLWEKIYKIQKIGGSMSLCGMMQNIMNKSNFLISNLNNTLNSFKKEEADDNYQRQRFGNDWIRYAYSYAFIVSAALLWGTGILKLINNGLDNKSIKISFNGNTNFYK